MTRRGRPPHDDRLTPAEWRVTELVRHGLSTARIATHLGISLYGARSLARSATAKLGLAGRAELRNWTGVRKGSARAPSTGADPMHPLGPLGQIARRVENLDRARAFWRDLLGLPELYAFPGLAFYDLGGTRLMLRETGKREEADILYLAVPDIGTAHAHLTEKGADFTGAPHLIHRHPDGCEEWMAFFKDDEDRDLALHARIGP
jgi:DNA-binding CsgD family transcriptional regulator/catechol 2,3-dioxygenase-like lactoylglutathione lyase family enzyme